MTEQTIYMIIGILGYFVAYGLTGLLTTGLWEMWAWKQVGEFWEYTLNEGLRAYYPGFWYFIRWHNILYSALYMAFWPIVIPWQVTTNTKAMRKVMHRGYHF